MHATMAALRRNSGWFILGYDTLTLGFEGNIDAEIPCITTNGLSVTECGGAEPDRIRPNTDTSASPFRCIATINGPRAAELAAETAVGTLGGC